MSESKLYKNFKALWSDYIERIEAKSTGSGMPDLHLVNMNNENIFLELKYWKLNYLPKKIKLRPSQKRWFLEYPKQNAFLLIQLDTGKQIFYYLLNKKEVKDYINFGLCKAMSNNRFISSQELHYLINYLNNYK